MAVAMEMSMETQPHYNTEKRVDCKVVYHMGAYDVDAMNIPHLKEMKTREWYLIHSVSRQK